MTESDWLACRDPQAMLDFLRGKRLTSRKRRLFAVALCRHFEDILTHPASRVGVEVAERYADRLASDEERTAARKSHQAAYQRGDRHPRPGVYQAVRELTAHPKGFREIFVWAGVASAREHNPFIISILRDLFGNPFQASALPNSVLAWNDACVVRLAEGVYEDRLLPAGTFRPDRLAVLADALEEAGCTDADILGHLRGPGPHVRGCFAVDLILNKE
jgi:hypothetical protein